MGDVLGVEGLARQLANGRIGDVMATLRTNGLGTVNLLADILPFARDRRLPSEGGATRRNSTWQRSSLCRARVLPTVSEGVLDPARTWLATSITPGRRPVQALAAALAEVRVQLGIGRPGVRWPVITRAASARRRRIRVAGDIAVPGRAADEPRGAAQCHSGRRAPRPRG